MLTVILAPDVVALGTILTAVMLAPGPLRVPHTHSGYVTVLHVLVLAGLLRLLLRWAGRSMPLSALGWTSLHTAWLAFIVIAFATGVVFVASAGPPAGATPRLVDLVAQLSFFVVVLALVRA